MSIKFKYITREKEHCNRWQDKCGQRKITIEHRLLSTDSVAKHVVLSVRGEVVKALARGIEW
ncbi:hypothetical protein MUB24_02760 [Lederbergia sp. NSJ-179]|uniref:hypothetical protein n=1 Tax=Lederbergia sp. NSJ-179 TaxID=2931402 RepID=UPI001FD39DA9|nr:hypothetical protein [Lederbergia sp. NSJ-179]MCJ7839850.1 hypothetical protein [Lederbergia sp. NSJ-179]